MSDECEFCEIDGYGNHAPRCPEQLEAERDEALSRLGACERLAAFWHSIGGESPQYAQAAIDLSSILTADVDELRETDSSTAERGQYCTEHEFVSPQNEIIKAEGWLVCAQCGKLQPPEGAEAEPHDTAGEGRGKGDG